MPAKFAMNKSVKIVSVKNYDLNAKYPGIAQNASQTGTVIHSHEVAQSTGEKSAPWTYNIYVVRLSKSGGFVTVPEDALVAM